MFCRTLLFHHCRSHQGFRHRQNHAFLPAFSDGAYDYCHRACAFGQCHTELHYQLDFGPCSHPDCHLFQCVGQAAWIGLPVSRERTALAVIDNLDTTFLISSIIAIMPIAIATIMEHIGDMCAISSTVGKDFLKDPGLHRTLMGDGLATSMASLFGAPANTTYGENTGVLNLTKVYDPAVIRLAAIIAVLLSFCPKFACLIGLMPAATIGGVSLILYGMISAVGVRNLVEDGVDFSSSRNVFVAASVPFISQDWHCPPL